jgi:hypothetical protein
MIRLCLHIIKPWDVMVPFDVVLEALSFKNSFEGRSQELVFGIQVLDDFLKKESKGVRFRCC